MKKILFYLVLALFLLQLYRPAKNISEEVSQNSITNFKVPENIQNILEVSCYDCHSNNTNYLWYHNIAPVSWVVAHHIKEGKEHVNFDEWATYNNDQKEHIIEEMIETIESREMPLVGYIKLHPEAVISEADNLKLLDWIRSLEIE